MIYLYRCSGGNIQRKDIKMDIWYLYHSGFAVKTENHFLIFDYWRDTPKGGNICDGVINTKELWEEDVIVFASHRHSDHYNRVIERWQREIPRCRLILSDDIKKNDDAIMVSPNKDYRQPDFSFKTFLSNDEGVAFLLNIDDKIIFHAGDLNWWHWDGEPDNWNDEMRDSYQSQIDMLKGLSIDLAFIPVDPRLEAEYYYGIDYLMRTADVKKVVPMHFGDKHGVVQRLLKDSISEEYRDRILPLMRRGQKAEIL